MIRSASLHEAVRALMGVGLVIVGIITVGVFQHSLDQHSSKSTDQMEELTRLPQGQTLKPMLLGYQHLGADMMWLRLLQVLGKKNNTAEEYEWIYRALDVVTTLDPQYDYAYYVGGVTLTNLAKRVDLSNRLLEKGFKENPRVWNLPFLLGYNNYFVLGNAVKGAEYIAQAARLPGGPAYLPGLASRMYAEGNNPQVAMELLRELWLQTRDQDMRQMLEGRAKEIAVEQDLGLLESARESYVQQFGKMPKSFADLVKSGKLSAVPVEPFGGQYVFEPETGRIYSTTHPSRLRVFRLDKEGEVRKGPYGMFQ